MMGQVTQHYSQFDQKNGPPQCNNPSLHQYSQQYQMPVNYGNHMGLMLGQMQAVPGQAVPRQMQASFVPPGNNLMHGQFQAQGFSQVIQGHGHGLLPHSTQPMAMQGVPLQSSPGKMMQGVPLQSSPGKMDVSPLSFTMKSSARFPRKKKRRKRKHKMERAGGKLELPSMNIDDPGMPFDESRDMALYEKARLEIESPLKCEVNEGNGGIKTYERFKVHDGGQKVCIGMNFLTGDRLKPAMITTELATETFG